ncbi:MAG: ATP-dependent DNA ligase, partial [Cyclobacteriaceae bacterium]
ERTFGSLQLAEQTQDGLIYRGGVGTGFDDKRLKDMRKRLDEIASDDKPVDQEVHHEKDTNWVEPVLVCEIEYSMITDNGTFRDPVFKKLVE